MPHLPFARLLCVAGILAIAGTPAHGSEIPSEFERPSPFLTTNAPPREDPIPNFNLLAVLPTGADDMHNIGALSGFGFVEYGSSHWHGDGSRTPDPWVATENIHLQPWRNLLATDAGRPPSFGALHSNFDFSSNMIFAGDPAELARLTDPAASFWSGQGGNAAYYNPSQPLATRQGPLPAGMVAASGARGPGGDPNDQGVLLGVIGSYFDISDAGAKQRLISAADSDIAIIVGPDRRIDLVNLATGDSVTVNQKVEAQPLDPETQAARDRGSNVQYPTDMIGETFELTPMEVIRNILSSPFFILFALACIVIVLGVQYIDRRMQSTYLQQQRLVPVRRRKRKRRVVPHEADGNPQAADFAGNGTEKASFPPSSTPRPRNIPPLQTGSTPPTLVLTQELDLNDQPILRHAPAASPFAADDLGGPTLVRRRRKKRRWRPYP